MYKVWVHIEEIDEERDHCVDVAEPECIGTFEKLEEAENFVSALPSV